MTGAPGPRGTGRRPSRHERPEIDAAALEAARAVEHASTACRAVGADRWVDYFAPIPDGLRDAPIEDLRAVALRARAAFGPKDSILEILGPDVTGPLRESIDRLLRMLARETAHPRDQ